MAPRQKKEADPYWESRPAWLVKVDKVMKLRSRGFEDESQISALTDVPTIEVKRIIEDENTAKAIAIKNYKEKIPVMEDIAGLGLDILRESLKELMDPEFRTRMITKISDIAALKNVIQDISMLVRLEKGQSTNNMAVETRSYQETRKIIQDLRKIDPVFSYPEIPEGVPPLPEDKE